MRMEMTPEAPPPTRALGAGPQLRSRCAPVREAAEAGELGLGGAGLLGGYRLP